YHPTLPAPPPAPTPAPQIPPTPTNPTPPPSIKTTPPRLPLLDGPTTDATTGLFFPVRNIFDSRQEMVRIDHQFRQGFNIWGRLTIDDIPTTEAGGLFGLSSVPNMAATRTNSPGRGVVVHAVNTFGKA